jgi:hypothetical protein
MAAPKQRQAFYVEYPEQCLQMREMITYHSKFRAFPGPNETLLPIMHNARKGTLDDNREK